MHAKLLMAVALMILATGCVSMQGPRVSAPKSEAERNAICAALNVVEWDEHDPDHISDTLTKSLGAVLEARQRAGCPEE
jgi:hypothetical protein